MSRISGALRMPLIDPLETTELERAPAPKKKARPTDIRADLLPTTKSRRALEKAGYLVGDVESQIPGSFIKRDLFGFGDLLAVKRGEILLVQACALGDISKRIAKIANHENVARVRESGMRIEVHGWDGLRLRVEDLS